MSTRASQKLRLHFHLSIDRRETSSDQYRVRIYCTIILHYRNISRQGREQNSGPFGYESRNEN